MARPQYKLGGRTFTLAPCTYEMYERVKEEEPVLNDKLQAGEIDRFDYYLSVLKIVLEGPVADLEKTDFCSREAEEIIEGFLPPSMRMRARLMGL